MLTRSLLAWIYFRYDFRGDPLLFFYPGPIGWAGGWRCWDEVTPNQRNAFSFAFRSDDTRHCWGPRTTRSGYLHSFLMVVAWAIFPPNFWESYQVYSSKLVHCRVEYFTCNVISNNYKYFRHAQFRAKNDSSCWAMQSFFTCLDCESFGPKELTSVHWIRNTSWWSAKRSWKSEFQGI
jgi:hypothetical protein